jgi:hypothetical protein
MVSYHHPPMKFLKKFAGKWVAIKGEKVIDTSETLKDLMQRTGKRKDQAEVGYSLVPKGCFAGTSYGD